jgi:hypothetical protein
MTGSSTWNISAVLDVDEVPAHMLVSPGCVAGEIGNVVPFVVRGPGEVHCIDLRATTKCCTAWVVEAGADVAAALVHVRSLSGQVHGVDIRFSSSWWIGSHMV